MAMVFPAIGVRPSPPRRRKNDLIAAPSACAVLSHPPWKMSRWRLVGGGTRRKTWNAPFVSPKRMDGPSGRQIGVTAGVRWPALTKVPRRAGIDLVDPKEPG